ncbi:MAG: translesion DNA synthesis-associated protein ImuA [Rhodoferax sp.]
MKLSACLHAPWGAQVWPADALAQPEVGVWPSGHAALDAQLPGGGWPRGALCEILQPPGMHAHWQLLLPAVRAQTRAGADTPWVALVGAPHTPYGPALAAQGLPPERVLWLRAHTLAERLWTAEQLLLTDAPLFLLLWLTTETAPGPGADPAEARSDAVDANALRRLQRAAGVRPQMLFVLRPLTAARQPSPARVRVAVRWPTAATVSRCLQLEVLKRRGPPLSRVLELPLDHALDRCAA